MRTTIRSIRQLGWVRGNLHCCREECQSHVKWFLMRFPETCEVFVHRRKYFKATLYLGEWNAPWGITIREAIVGTVGIYSALWAMLARPRAAAMSSSLPRIWEAAASFQPDGADRWRPFLSETVSGFVLKPVRGRGTGTHPVGGGPKKGQRTGGWVPAGPTHPLPAQFPMGGG